MCACGGVWSIYLFSYRIEKRLFQKSDMYEIAGFHFFTVKTFVLTLTKESQASNVYISFFLKSEKRAIIKSNFP